MNTLTLALERASLIGMMALIIAWLAQKFLDSRVPAAWRVWIWRVALLQAGLALLPLSPIRLAVLPAPVSPIYSPAEVGRAALLRTNQKPRVSDSGDTGVIPDSGAKLMAPVGNESAMAVSAPASADSSQLEVLKLWCYWNQDKIWLVLQGIYLLGIGFQVVKLARSSRRLRRALRSAVQVEATELGAGLRDAARRMQVSLPRLVQIEGSAPFLVGVFRPRIVLPSVTATSQQLEAILSHELAHVKRRDLAWNALAWSIQTALWFHPLSWVSRYFLPLEIESACDEMVLASSRITPNSYGALLLNTLGIERTPLAAGVTDGFSTLKTRLLRLSHAPKQPKRAGKIIFACVLGLAIIMVLPLRLVTHSQAAPNRALAANDEESEQKQSLIAKIGTVQGTVLSPDGQPVPGARISWVSYNGEGAARETIIAKAQSDVQGKFRFENSKTLLEKSFRFVGPTQQTSPPQLLIEAEGWGCFATQINNAISQPSEFRLTRPTELQATFLDSQGQPVANLPVRLSFVFFEKAGGQASNFNYIHFGELKYFNLTTDANGVFHMGGLPQGGRARLEIDDDRFAQPDYQVAEVNLARQAQTIAQPIRLEPGASLQGRVVNGETGKPVAGIRVAAQGQDPTNGWGEAISEKDGTYRLSMLKAGRYNLALDLDDKMNQLWTASAHEGVSVAAGSQKTNLDFQLERGALITGRVVAIGSGEPVAGAMIGIYGPAHPKSSAWVQGVTSDSGGNYQTRVPAGDQYIYIMGAPEGFVRPESQPVSSVAFAGKHSTPYEFAAEDGQSETIDWQLTALPPARAVQVRVLDANGQPAKNAQIEFSATGAEERSATGEPAKQGADAQGRATLENVRGSIQIWARSGTDASPEAKTAMGGQSVTLNLQANALVELKGTVVDEAGKPLPGIKVDLLRWVQQSGQVGNSVLSDAQGNYSFDELWPDAEYSLSVNVSGYGAGFVEKFRSKPGETRVLKTIELPKTGSFIAGRVVDAADKPLSDVMVWISGKKTGSVQAKTDEKGNFRQEAIVPHDALHLIASLDSRFGTANAQAGTSDTTIILEKQER